MPGNIPHSDAGSPLHDQYLAPLGITGDTTRAFYRISDLGKRDEQRRGRSSTTSPSAPRACFRNWDYNAAYTHSESDVKGNISGYPGALAVGSLHASGAARIRSSARASRRRRRNDALACGQLQGLLGRRHGQARHAVDCAAPRELMKMPAGAAACSASGANYRRRSSSPSRACSPRACWPIRWPARCAIRSNAADPATSASATRRRCRPTRPTASPGASSANS